MIKNIMKNIAEEVVEATDNSMIIAMEECSELQKEISKMIRNKGNITELTEEIADVIISIEFIKSKYEISDTDINYWLEKKLSRIRRKLDNNEFY